MSENVDKAPRRASHARLFAAPLLLFVGVSLAVCLLAAHANDDPYGTPFFHLFFSNTLHMKAWLTTGTLKPPIDSAKCRAKPMLREAAGCRSCS